MATLCDWLTNYPIPIWNHLHIICFQYVKVWKKQRHSPENQYRTNDDAVYAVDDVFQQKEVKVLKDVILELKHG